MALWNEDDQNEEFRDVPEETSKDYGPQPVVAAPVQRPVAQPAKQGQQYNGATGRFEEPVLDAHDEQFLEAVLESVETEEDFTDLMNDANLRIEQGRLYQMIMNHNLFEGMDADPRAVAAVQHEIRKIARERMEIMLGMRQEQPKTVVSSSQFNDLEVHMLKMLASKVSGGATEAPEANEVAATVAQAPKRSTLNPIGGSIGLKKAAVAKPQAKPSQPLAKSPAAPVKRTKQDLLIDQIVAEENAKDPRTRITREDLELQYSGIGKQIHELTEEEILARHRQAKQRLGGKTSVKATNAIPMPSMEQQEMMAMQTAQRAQGATGSLSAMILEKVKNMPIKNP
jgi:hypothetical protein